MAKTRTARFELLDAMRGIAILAVLLLHFVERGVESNDQIIHAQFWPLLQHGYLGVQLFFVISGYCITAALYGAIDKPKSFRYFVVRRLRRIFPPYWASIVLVVGLGFATMAILKTSSEIVFPLRPFDWFCNILLIQGPLHAIDANMVYWSLSIELQFYLVMALALLWPRWIEAWLIAFTLLCMMLSHLTQYPWWGTIVAYWAEFLCGIAAFYWITGRMRWKATPAVFLAIVVLDIGLQSPQYDSLFQANGRFIQPMKLLFCLASMLSMMGLRQYDKIVSEWRSVKWLSYFGVISYSLYLTHVPISTRIFNLGNRIYGLSDLRWILFFFLSFVVCTLAGWLFFFLFERPWLNTVIGSTPVMERLAAAEFDAGTEY